MVTPFDLEKDPVCGKHVQTEGAPKSEYMGRPYYFCSTEHKEAFDADPRHYMKVVQKAGAVIERGRKTGE